MAASIFSLFGEIFVDNQKANENIDKTTEKGQSMGEKLQAGFGTVGKAAAAIGAAAATAGKALWDTAKNAAAVTDQIDKQSQAMGVSREGYQEWTYILSQNGASIEDMQKAVKTLGGTMEGTSKNGVAAMEALGISFDGMNKEEAFEAAVTALQGIEDETLKAQLAQDLFGNSFQKLMPLVNGTAEGTEELRQRAHDLGLVLSDDAVSGGVAFTDALDNMNRGFGALTTQLGTALFPILTQGMDYIIQLLPLFQEIAQQLIPVLLGLMETLMPLFIQVVESILPPLLSVITSIIPLFTTIVQTLLPPILDIISQLLPFVAQIVQSLLPPLVQLLNSVIPILQPIISSILPVLMKLLQTVIEPLTQLLNLILPPLTEVIKVLGGIISDVLAGAFNALTPIIENVKTHFTQLIDFVKNVFTGNWEGAWENVKNIFKNIVDGLGNIFKAPLNFIINGINAFIRGLNQLQIPDWVPGIGGKGFNIGEIPLLAKGGRITQEGLAVVGEAGPELVNLNRGAEVVPLNTTNNSKTDLNVNINIANFNNANGQDIETLADQISRAIEAKLRRREAVYA
ncbi:hypothetical protein FACS18948_5270 [Clostridia bacterium]|nr:hypothetical protein FACS18948_5270 [Clostridia bacterium]